MVKVHSIAGGYRKPIVLALLLGCMSLTTAEDGETLYRRHCATCHQSDGAGFAMVPALAGNAVALGNRGVAIELVLLGRGGMPGFADILDDAELAVVLTHVRSSWGNHGSPVTSSAVAGIRAERVGPEPVEVDLPDDWFEFGEAAYLQNCSACHQASGEGIPGAFPAIAGNPFVTGNADALLRLLLHGRAGMPAFGDNLDNATIAHITSYIRNAWENEAHLVDAEMVEVVRGGGDLDLDPTTPTFRPGAGN